MEEKIYKTQYLYQYVYKVSINSPYRLLIEKKSDLN